MADMPIEVAVTSLSVSLIETALEATSAFENEAAFSPEKTTYILGTALLLASVNFAIERGSTPEEAADVLEKFAARLRSGEAAERASERREEFRLWAEEQRAEKGGA